MAKSVAEKAVSGTVDRAGFEFTDKEQISFPPYWKPVVGKSFVAMPMCRDERDPEFIRYHLVAFEDMLDCVSGPVDSATPEPVKKGETFTIGKYATLPLDFYMGLPEPLLITVEGTRPSEGKKSDMFIWSIRPTAKCKKIMALRRADPNNELPAGMVRPQFGTNAALAE